MSDFEKVQYVRQCCFSILPQVYCDKFSITEQIGKIVEALNELISNNNKIEDYVKDVIREVIESGEIEDIIKDMLANYLLNVKYPPDGIEPASGDGSKDDTLAIQGCIDYASSRGGMAVFFPSGVYLTRSIDIKDKVTLVGFDRDNTRLVLKGGATRPLLNGSVNEFNVSNLGFDNNGDIQVNDLNLIDIQIKRASIFNLKLTDGYTLLKINVEEFLQIANVVFDYAITNAGVFTGNGVIQANNLYVNSVSALKQESAFTINTNNGSFINIYSKANLNTTFILNGSNNVINGTVINNTGNVFDDRGANNSVIHYPVAKREKFSGNIYQEAENNTETYRQNYNLTVNVMNSNIKTNNINSENIKEEITVKKIITTPEITETFSNKKTETGAEKSENINKKTETSAEKTEYIDKKTTNTQLSYHTSNFIEERITPLAGINPNKDQFIAGNKNVNVDGDIIEKVGGNYTEEITGNKELKSPSIFLNGELKYSKPVNVNDFYSNVPIRDTDGNLYNVMVATGNTENLSNTIGKDVYLCIGDSYAEGTGPSGIGQYTPWLNTFKTALGLTDNVDFFHAEKGGAGFVAANSGENFLDIITRFTNSASTATKKRITKILVAGGFNDRNLGADIVSKMSEFMNYVKANYPKAKVYVACIGWSNNTTYRNDIVNTAVYYYSKVDRYGAIYIENSQFCLHDYTWFSSDQIHPNNSGQFNIGAKLAQGVVTGICTNYYPLQNITFNRNTTYFTSASVLSGYVKIDNNLTTIFIDGDSVLKCNSSITITAGNTYDIGTLEQNYIISANNKKFTALPFTGYIDWLNGSNHNYKEINGAMWLEGKTLKMQIMNINQDGTTFMVMTNVQEIQLRFNTVNINSLYC